jgi:hypothetical protein
MAAEGINFSIILIRNNLLLSSLVTLSYDMTSKTARTLMNTESKIITC